MFTLRNSGGASTSALNVALGSSSTAFTIVGNTCTAASLGPRKTCTVVVQYAPTSQAAGDTSTLTATSNKPAASSSLTLRGTSSVPAAPYRFVTPTYSVSFSPHPYTSACDVTTVISGLEPSRAYVLRKTDTSPGFGDFSYNGDPITSDAGGVVTDVDHQNPLSSGDSVSFQMLDTSYQAVSPVSSTTLVSC